VLVLSRSLGDWAGRAKWTKAARGAAGSQPWATAQSVGVACGPMRP